tara:strand:+ start:555 stop:746 length:192 start_codon:yes stop_codon:yes gene_type:complete
MQGCEKCKKCCGIIFLVLGILFLLGDLGVWNFWNISWWTALFVVMGLGGLAAAGCPMCKKALK